MPPLSPFAEKFINAATALLLPREERKGRDEAQGRGCPPHCPRCLPPAGQQHAASGLKVPWCCRLRETKRDQLKINLCVSC